MESFNKGSITSFSVKCHFSIQKHMHSNPRSDAQSRWSSYPEKAQKVSEAKTPALEKFLLDFLQPFALTCVYSYSFQNPLYVLAPAASWRYPQVHPMDETDRWQPELAHVSQVRVLEVSFSMTGSRSPCMASIFDANWHFQIGCGKAQCHLQSRHVHVPWLEGKMCWAHRCCRLCCFTWLVWIPYTVGKYNPSLNLNLFLVSSDLL